MIDMRLIDADALIDYLQIIPIDLGYREVEEIEEYVRSMPTIEPERKKGTWILDNSRLRGNRYICDQCGYETDTSWNPPGHFCTNCGAEMRTPVETARDIVHTAIDNSVWSDAVDTAKMHKIVDDKYAEMEGQDERDI